MARFFTRRPAPVTAPEAGSLLAEHGLAETCASYAPGHQMHYVHQGQALRSPSVRASNVIVEGHRVVVVLEGGDQLDYQHHEPDRLGSILGLFPGSRVAYPKFHALRVGPYWFNCAPDEFTPCRPDAGADRP
jgi:hypothetical protein